MAERANLSRTGTAAVLAVAILAAGCSGGRPMGLRTDTSSPTDSAVDTAARIRNRESFERDVRAVQAYGAQHPDEYAGIAVDHERRPAGVLAHFTRDLDEHERALRPRMEQSERLVMVQARLSISEQATIDAELDEMDLPRRFSSVGPMGIRLSLDFTAATVAEDLWRRYEGRFESLSVGNFRYPLALGVDVCPALPDVSERTAGLSARATLPSRIVADGAPIVGEFVLRNTGSTAITATAGAGVDALLLGADGRVMSAPAPGVHPAVGRAIDLAPGEEQTIPLHLEPAPCRSDDGWLLPEGSYQAVGVLNVDGLTVVSDPVVVTLTE